MQPAHFVRRICKEFRERFNKLSFDGLEPKMMSPQITVDAEISLSQITPEVY